MLAMTKTRETEASIFHRRVTVPDTLARSLSCRGPVSLPVLIVVGGVRSGAAGSHVTVGI